MKIRIKKLPKSQMEIWFEVPTKEFERFVERAISDLGKDFATPGFRKGKAPKEIIEEKIGLGKILNKAAELTVKENYLKVILEKKIEVISQPQIEILKLAKGNPFEFKATFSVLPEVDLPDYKKIASQIKKRKISVQEKEIEKTLLWLQKSRAKFIFENRPAKKGDFVEIEFQSPQIEEGLKRKDNFILGQGHFIAGFEENLEGMTPNQEKEFSLKFPKNLQSQKDLAGNLVDFKVKMNSVQKMELPEINDQFARGLGKFESLAGLKKSIEEGIKREKENQEIQRRRNEILDKISQETKMEIPEILLQGEKKRMLEDFQKLISEKVKTSFQDYLAKIKKTEKEILDAFEPEAERKIKHSLVLREIANQEKIEVSEGETKVEINKFFKNYPNFKETKKELDLEKLKSYYEGVIKNEKTLAKLESFVS